ncbi:MAG: hypothetical protein ACI9D0_001159, partial [Bacteroidia bacterium]
LDGTRSQPPSTRSERQKAEARLQLQSGLSF